MLNYILEYWIHFLFGIIISLITYLFKTIKDYKNKMKCLNKSIIFLLKIELIKNYELLINKKTITYEEKDNYDLLYENYKCFTNDLVIDDLFKKINDIPIV